MDAAYSGRMSMLVRNAIGKDMHTMIAPIGNAQLISLFISNVVQIPR